MFLACAGGRPANPAVSQEEGGIGTADEQGTVRRTLQSFLALAAGGDAASQNLLGFLFFYGQSAPHDPEAAAYWFQKAAAAGDPSAQVNLAILHELGTVLPRDRQSALSYFRRARANPSRPVSLPLTSLFDVVQRACAPPPEPDRGSFLFATFCAGCHGQMGISTHPLAPHFALGERMDQPDDVLLETVLTGHGLMPEWSDKFPPEVLGEALRHARRLQLEFRHATLHRPRPEPNRTFRFGEMDRTGGDPPPEILERPAGPSFGDACDGR